MMDGDDDDEGDIDDFPPIVEIDAVAFRQGARAFMEIVWSKPGAAVVVKSRGRANLVLQRLNDAK